MFTVFSAYLCGILPRVNRVKGVNGFFKELCGAGIGRAGEPGGVSSSSLALIRYPMPGGRGSGYDGERRGGRRGRMTTTLRSVHLTFAPDGGVEVAVEYEHGGLGGEPPNPGTSTRTARADLAINPGTHRRTWRGRKSGPR